MKTSNIQKEVRAKQVSMSPQQIAQIYKDLQIYFQQVYRDQQIKKNKDALKRLDAMRNAIAFAVQTFQKNPQDPTPLTNIVSKSAKELADMSSLEVPSGLRKEIALTQGKPQTSSVATKPLPVQSTAKQLEVKKDLGSSKVVSPERSEEHKDKQESEKEKKEELRSKHEPKSEQKKEDSKQDNASKGTHDSEDKQHPHLVTEHERMPSFIQTVPKGEVLQEYEVESNGAKVKVKIIKETLGVSYNLFIPQIRIPTAMLLTEVRNELITITNISMKELTDPKSYNKIKQKFIDKAKELLKEKLPHIETETEVFLIGQLIQDMLGLGKIEYLINDPNLEEIVIQSSKEPVRVYVKGHGWLSSNLRIEKEEDIINYANIIARRVGRQINVLSPLLDAHLVTGDRINAVLYPISTKGNNITIRKFARDPYTIVDLINTKTCDLEIAALLWLAIEYEMNVIISGGTASGKTVFLNACMPFIPPNQKVLSIEDTRELMLPEFLYWDPLVTRTPNPEGKGEVSMLHLLVNSLRMRPDRIVLGEMRRHEEAMVLFEAMHTGHSVYATVHAESGAETVSRLVNPPLSVPANLLKAVNLNVIMFRDRRRGLRRVLQIAEFEADGNSAKANIIYRWLQEEDRMIKHSESTRFFEDIARHTGFNQAQIKANLDEKKNIISWLIKHNIRDLKSFGEVMNYYYRNKDILVDAMRKNDPSMVVASIKKKKGAKHLPSKKHKMGHTAHQTHRKGHKTEHVTHKTHAHTAHKAKHTAKTHVTKHAKSHTPKKKELHHAQKKTTHTSKKHTAKKASHAEKKQAPKHHAQKKAHK